AAPDYQLLGVYDKVWCEPLAHALKALGCKAAWVVHGSDGMDELTLTGSSTVAELKEGVIRVFDITPEDAGLARASLEELRGGDPEHNAKALMHALSGADSAYPRAVIYNAAAGFVIAGKAEHIKAG